MRNPAESDAESGHHDGSRSLHAPRSPSIRTAHDARLTGRGMNLVDALSTQWGVEPDPPGKKVWFELPA
jgi:hypothetical protein